MIDMNIIILNYELEGMWKEAVVVCFNVIP